MSEFTIMSCSPDETLEVKRRNEMELVEERIIRLRDEWAKGMKGWASLDTLITDLQDQLALLRKLKGEG